MNNNKSTFSFVLFFHVLRVTALIVKMLSFVTQRQTKEERKNVRLGEDIRRSVSYLLSVQKHDGSFSDPNPVLHKGTLVNSHKINVLCILEHI